MPKDKKLLTEKQLEAISINDFDLHNELVKYPGELAYWNARYSDAIEEYLLAKHEYEIVKARIYLTIKTERTLKAKKSKSKPPTGDDMKALVPDDVEYQEVHMDLIETEIEKEKCRRFAEAMVAKGDMLRSLGAKLREEMKGDPSVRREHAYENHRKPENEY
jgi:hypothetical protein